MLRRSFLEWLAGAVLGARWLFGPAAAATGYRFDHGVASGDPLADAVVLWTRVSGAAGEDVRLRWLVAEDPALERVVTQGETLATAARDYTVKVDADGLPAGATLYFAFETVAGRSPVGRTRTLPVGDVPLVRFGVVSCSNHPAGYFNVYRDIAQRDDLDAVIHLGDFIYEYGLGGYATGMAEKLGRVPEPANELLTLDDYRRRHAQYKADPDSRAMLAAHPLIAVWDDHEIANDAWRTGAENHGAAEGDWEARRAAAIRAYYEWMPVRGEPDARGARLYRRFDYGGLLRLVMLDTRHDGRDPQPDISATDGSRDAVLEVVDRGRRRMLGRRQERWLRRQLATADTTWQVIGQQVLVANLDMPLLEPLLDLDKPSYLSREELESLVARSRTSPPALLDLWDGYPRARRRLLRDIRRHARNAVILSGDLHTPMAADLVLDDDPRIVAVEFMPSSVTSPGFADYLPEREPGALSAATLRQNPGLRYMETARRGWLCLSVTEDECTGEWHHVDTILSRDYTSRVERRLVARAGDIGAGLQEA